MMAKDDDDESESVRDRWLLRDTGACVSQDYLSPLPVLRHQAGSGCGGLLFVISLTHDTS